MCTRGGRRLLTHREENSPTTLKKTDGLYVRFRAKDTLIVDVYRDARI